MRDLLVITPTRGRLASVTRLADALKRTCTADTSLVLGMDLDDDSYAGADLPAIFGSGTGIEIGQRKSCAAWSNLLAERYGKGFRYLASLGDDHLPETPGWDSLLIRTIERAGGTGIAYGNDLLQGWKLPTAPLMSADIVHALGWMFLPASSRLYCDNVWRDLGLGAGCLYYEEQVIVRHLHWTSGLSAKDQTAIDAEPAWAKDEAAYYDWVRDGRDADVAKVRELMEARCRL